MAHSRGNRGWTAMPGKVRAIPASISTTVPAVQKELSGERALVVEDAFVPRHILSVYPGSGGFVASRRASLSLDPVSLAHREARHNPRLYWLEPVREAHVRPGIGEGFGKNGRVEHQEQHRQDSI